MFSNIQIRRWLDLRSRLSSYYRHLLKFDGCCLYDFARWNVSRLWYAGLMCAKSYSKLRAYFFLSFMSGFSERGLPLDCPQFFQLTHHTKRILSHILHTHPFTLNAFIHFNILRIFRFSEYLQTAKVFMFMSNENHELKRTSLFRLSQ